MRSSSLGIIASGFKGCWSVFGAGWYPACSQGKNRSRSAKRALAGENEEIIRMASLSKGDLQYLSPKLETAPFDKMVSFMET